MRYQLSICERRAKLGSKGCGYVPWAPATIQHTTPIYITTTETSRYSRKTHKPATATSNGQKHFFGQGWRLEREKPPSGRGSLE